MPDLDPAFLRQPIAHRGLHARAAGRVENSRAAVDAAIAGGYGIEIDVQRSACGEAMVFHDDTLPRLTGAPGPLAARTAADLAALRLTGTDEPIPTLGEILARVAGRAPLLIEVKDQTGALGPDTGPLEARVADLLAGYAGPLALMSFNPHSVRALAAAAPGVPRGLTSCAFNRFEWRIDAARAAHLSGLGDFDAVGADFVSHQHSDLGNPAIARLGSRGIPILAWTIRSAQEEAAARRIAGNITFEGYAAALPD